MNIYLFFDQLSGSQEARFAAKNPHSTQRKPLYFVNLIADTLSKIVLDFKEIQKHANVLDIENSFWKLTNCQQLKFMKYKGWFLAKDLAFQDPDRVLDKK